jgi:hypothetical protein
MSKFNDKNYISADANLDRLATLKQCAEKEPQMREILAVVEQLTEPNVAGVWRLVNLFGITVVKAKAEEAIKLHNEAHAKGVEAYQELDSPVATRQGKPRTVGGVFFRLMELHATGLGLNWLALMLPRVNYNPAGTPSEMSNGTNSPQATTSVRTSPPKTPTPPASPKEAPAQAEALGKPETKPMPTQGQPPGALKPSRIKGTVIGTLEGKPKLNPQGQRDVVELNFKAEMNNPLPKGLPNLGTTPVVVWCNTRQWAKVADIVKPDTKFNIEGEIAAGVKADMTAFIRIICMNLTTAELEQAKRQK